MRRGETNSIGFLVGTIANPVISTIFEAAAEALATDGYAMSLVSSRNQADLDIACLRLLASRQVSGLIVSSASESPEPSRRFIQEMNIPTVMLDREPVEGERVFAVQSDHESSVREAVFHLIENGHRDIGFIGGPQGFYPTQQRCRAYQEALAEAGIPLRSELVRFASLTETDACAEGAPAAAESTAANGIDRGRQHYFDRRAASSARSSKLRSGVIWRWSPVMTSI